MDAKEREGGHERSEKILPQGRGGIRVKRSMVAARPHWRLCGFAASRENQSAQGRRCAIRIGIAIGIGIDPDTDSDIDVDEFRSRSAGRGLPPPAPPQMVKW